MYRNQYRGDSGRVISEQDAADYCGIPISSWRKMRASNLTPPSIQLSLRRRGYALNSLDTWLDERHPKPPNSSERLMDMIVKPFNRPLRELTVAEVGKATQHYAKLTEELKRRGQWLQGVA